MDNKKIVKYLKLAIVIAVIALFLWFLVINPLITFRGYEKDVENAAKRYFEINERELPTGTRIKTISVQELFNQSYFIHSSQVLKYLTACFPSKAISDL